MFKTMKTIFSDNVTDSDPDNSVLIDDVAGLKASIDKPLVIQNVVKNQEKKSAQPVVKAKGLSKVGLNFSKHLNSNKNISSMLGLDNLVQTFNNNFFEGFNDSLNEAKRPLSTKARKHMKERLDSSSSKN